MNAFVRGNLATAERELRTCIARLTDARFESVEVRRDPDVHAALLAAKWALEEIERTVRLAEVA